MSGAAHMANPAGRAGHGAPVLTEVAQSALQGLERFQGKFAADIALAEQPQTGVAAMRDAGAGTDVAPNQAMDQARMLVEQMQQTTKVQMQLVQFVTASSISSSLGRNLNMFLRGQ